MGPRLASAQGLRAEPLSSRLWCPAPRPRRSPEIRPGRSPHSVRGPCTGRIQAFCSPISGPRAQPHVGPGRRSPRSIRAWGTPVSGSLGATPRWHQGLGRSPVSRAWGAARCRVWGGSLTRKGREGTARAGGAGPSAVPEADSRWRGGGQRRHPATRTRARETRGSGAHGVQRPGTTATMPRRALWAADGDDRPPHRRTARRASPIITCFSTAARSQIRAQPVAGRNRLIRAGRGSSSQSSH